MINLQLSNGVLDVYNQDVEMQWQTVRFADGIRDAFSNDFDLPKTANNIMLLDACGLLDSPTQPLGQHIEPCVINMGDKVFDCYIQVVSVNEESISVTVWEKLIPSDILNIKINELLRDTEDNIWIWNPQSQTHYQNYFKKYQYSLSHGINDKYAQLHPSMDLNTVIQRINQNANIQIPLATQTHYAIATKKTVSPHNHIQVLEAHWTDDSGNFAVMSGGQHVTNDLEWSYSPDQTTITFNRNCRIKGDIYFSFKKKSTVTNNFYMMICRYRSGSPTYAPAYTIQSSQYASHVTWDTFQDTIHEGDTLRIQCNDTAKYELLSVLIKFEITNYTITDDDYGNEMKYIGRLPRLLCWSDNGMFRRGGGAWTSQGSSNGAYAYLWADGRIGGYYYHNTGSPNTLYPQLITIPDCSFSYFQYWCNLPEITIKDLMFGLCWLEGKKIVKEHIYNGYMMYPELQYVDANTSRVIDGRITQTRISSDTLGRKNYILQNGQNMSDTDPVSEIPNEWLERTKTLHSSPFTYAPWKFGLWYAINQYEDFEHEAGSEEYKVKFNDLDGLALADVGSVTSMLYRYSLNDMDFNAITQSIEVDIETYDDAKDCDFVFLEGHKYMVIEGSTNMETGYTTLKAVLVPFSEQGFTPTHQSPEPAEQMEGDNEPPIIPDANDEFDPAGEHPDYEWDDPLINEGNEPVTPIDPSIWDYEQNDDPWGIDYDQWG